MAVFSLTPCGRVRTEAWAEFMKTLYLHVGHQKTGSSAIQSFLRRHANTLRKQGLVYPVPNTQRGQSIYKITSGNGGILGDPTEIPTGARGVIFSHEQFFTQFPKRVRDVSAAAMAYGCDEIRVLLFTRDPVEHCRSLFQQSQKRNLNNEGVVAFAKAYDTPRKVIRFLDWAETLGVLVECHNYAVVGREALTISLNWLGAEIEGDLLAEESAKTVNRSLSKPEAELCRGLAKYFPPNFLSDALIEAIPDLPGDRLALPTEAVAAVLANNADAIAHVNERVPAVAAYRQENTETATLMTRSNDMLTFTHAQVKVIAESIGEQLLSLRTLVELERAKGEFQKARLLRVRGEQTKSLEAYHKARGLLSSLMVATPLTNVRDLCYQSIALIDEDLAERS